MTKKLALQVPIAILSSVLWLLSATPSASAQSATATPSSSSDTVVTVSNSVAMSGVKKLGINLGTQSFWDSGILLKNLVARNPGFEGGTWQSILHCVQVSASSCIDDNLYSVWPAGFFTGATGEFITGTSTGTTVSITGSTAASSSAAKGVSVSFSAGGTPAAGSYMVVRKAIPGNAPAGWWTAMAGGGAIGTEMSDLSPKSPGKQAVRLTASSANQTATISSYLDSTLGKSFLQLHGSYTLTFRAKGAGGTNALNVAFQRMPSTGSATQFFTQTVPLSASWQDYSFTFSANDTGVIGPLALSFQVSGSSALLDDVSLSELPGNSTNGTVFRDDVVDALTELRPGILRYMDSGQNWGSTIDNLLSVPFARTRPGYSNWNALSEEVPIGLHDFLVLCQQLGAEPWFTMPTGMSTAEASRLMEYLGGSSSSPYGAKRAALGQGSPWTDVFPRIHLEFGNEVWNSANPGATMTDASGYSERASTIFGTMRSSAYYTSTKFDFVVDGWAAVSSWDQTVLSQASNFDTIDVAPYLFYNFNDASSNEAIYAPLLAQPELYDSTTNGQVQTVASLARASGHKLSVYEVNLHTTTGTVPQATLNSVVPSLGAGLADIDHMLLMLRDAGVTEQAFFTLGGYRSIFTNSNSPNASVTTPLWGSVVDMGNTQRRRPDFQAVALANSAILPSLLSTAQSGTNPTWNQAQSSNDNIALSNAHYIQSFAFTDGTNAKMILLNLSRTSALPVAFAGVRAPVGSINVSTLTSASILDGNEDLAKVAVVSSGVTLQKGQSISLPAFSMTVLSWTLPQVRLTAAQCADSALAVSGTTTCSSDIATASSSSSAVTWTTSAGSIDTTGVYYAPATAPSNGTATITATSQVDPTQTASANINIVKAGPTSISLTCSATSVSVGTQDFCTASSTGVGSYDPTILWSATAGSVSSTGTFTAPATTGSVVVTATSAYNSSVKSNVTLSITPAALGISSVRINNITASSAVVSWNSGISTPDNGVSYGTSTAYGSTTPWSSVSTANPSYSISGLNADTTYYLQLFSQSGGKTVLYQTSFRTAASRSISSVTCGSSTVASAGNTTCTASASDGSSILWSASAGGITNAGVFTAPSTVSSTQTVAITATSASDASKSSSTTISVVPAQVNQVTVSCSSNSIQASSATNCVAAVSGIGNYSSQVTWSATAGTIDASGKFTAPAAAGNVTIVATSQQTPAITGSATVAVSGSTLAVTGITVTSVTSTSATVSWNAGALSTSGVSYGTTLRYGSVAPYSPTVSTSPTFTLTGLSPGTKYYLYLWSKSNGVVVSGTTSITTASN